MDKLTILVVVGLLLAGALYFDVFDVIPSTSCDEECKSRGYEWGYCNAGAEALECFQNQYGCTSEPWWVCCCGGLSNCPNICESGGEFICSDPCPDEWTPLTTTTITGWCDDSDGGKVYDTKGSCEDWESDRVWDYCDGDKVWEYYCSGRPQRCYKDYYSCPYGCSDGMCQDEPSTCSDTDGGKDYYQKGTTDALTGSTGTDYCYETGGVVEYYCEGAIGESEVWPCDCVDGRCVVPCDDGLICLWNDFFNWLKGLFGG